MTHHRPMAYRRRVARSTWLAIVLLIVTVAYFGWHVAMLVMGLTPPVWP